MRGSVIQKAGRWYVKIELDPDPATGRRRQKWHSGYRTKREAERARTDLLSKLDRGEYVEPSQQTLADFLTDWLAAIEPTVRPSTFDSYSRNIHNHVIAHIGATKLRRLDAGMLNGLYALLLRSGRRRPSRTGRGLLARCRRARASSFAPRADARGDGRTAASGVRRGVAHHEGHAGVARCDVTPIDRVVRVTGRTRSTNGQLRPHDPPPRLQGRRPLGPARSQPGRCRRPATRWPEVRRCPRLGCRHTADVPRAVPRIAVIASTHSGCCSRRPACGEARRSAFVGATSTSTPAGFGSSRRSPRPAAS